MSEHGAKHIARLEKRAATLEYRIAHSPGQADFDSERAERQSILWVIKELRKTGEHATRQRRAKQQTGDVKMKTVIVPSRITGGSVTFSSGRSVTLTSGASLSLEDDDANALLEGFVDSTPKGGAPADTAGNASG